MKRLISVAAAIVIAVSLCAAQNAQKTMKVSDVVDLVQAGIPEDVVITKLRKANHAFDLSAQEMLQLKKSGVSDNVIKAMIDPASPIAPSAPAASTISLPGMSSPKASGATPGAGTSEVSIAANVNNPEAPHDSGIFLYVDKDNHKVAPLPKV
jgi:hypothetical protein